MRRSSSSARCFAAAALPPKPARPDLEATPSITYPASSSSNTALLPTFGGSPANVTYVEQAVPKLDKQTIQRVKAAAIAALPADLQASIKSIKTVGPSGFQHPSCMVSPAELAVMKDRLNNGQQPQTMAKDALLTGKYYAFDAKIAAPKSFKGWVLPYDTPATGYAGPYPIEKVCIGYGGSTSLTSFPPVGAAANLPKEAGSSYQHLAFVELDSTMAIKQATAFHATGDSRHAVNAFAIIKAWAATNKSWDLIGQNGPLEAAWGIAAMAKALELLRGRQQFEAVRGQFLAWNSSVMLRQMDHYMNDTLDKVAKGQGLNLFGNWHSSIVDAYMSLAILGDDRARYNKAVDLFHRTVKDYVWKWGRDPAFSKGRRPGEITETLRDMYHSQFGIGGLLNVAEMAWQQDDDLYCSNQYALVTAMELHARFVRSALLKDPSLLPPEYAMLDFKQPPFNAAPSNTWAFDIKDQVWRCTKDGTSSVLNDPRKFLRDIGFLPAAWEVGYNHFAGRLGLAMPETAAVLQAYWPEWQEFHWGLGSLTHGDTAGLLWRAGVNSALQPPAS
ncbi:hypothetical protein OEZ85_007252 [Tetradesmus obliquus]|uniref:Alginate lyase domain-containing protein n=1 Tax=Tetradesmus obliquus TaxID=3088 RepID=A0ABY8TX28_TETOB|nr:hypothetical protein OEZ85_007252 [Tetradesmus obliquus]